MKKKKKLFNSLKYSEKLRRDEELKSYGKLLSLRPSKVHSSKKVYKRVKKVNLDSEYD